MKVLPTLGSAAALAEELGASPRDISSALARYEAKRLAFGRELVDYARKLGAASLAPDEIRDPERVIGNREIRARC